MRLFSWVNNQSMDDLCNVLIEIVQVTPVITVSSSCYSESDRDRPSRYVQLRHAASSGNRR
jgi:hypothetical protein